MFKMVEIVGISHEGFSKAVKNAIEELLKHGYKMFWFEVVEQRGAINAGQLKEYQVKLKVAIEFS